MPLIHTQILSPISLAFTMTMLLVDRQKAMTWLNMLDFFSNMMYSQLNWDISIMIKYGLHSQNGFRFFSFSFLESQAAYMFMVHKIPSIKGNLITFQPIISICRPKNKVNTAIYKSISNTQAVCYEVKIFFIIIKLLTIYSCWGWIVEGPIFGYLAGSSVTV